MRRFNRSPQSQSNETLARHIQRTGSRTEAPIAPMPDKEGVCRWCGWPLKSVIDAFEPADYCQRGCAKNDQAPFLVDCQECRRPFKTGKRGAILCVECDGREQREFVDGHKGSGFQARRDIYASGAKERRGDR